MGLPKREIIQETSLQWIGLSERIGTIVGRGVYIYERQGNGMKPKEVWWTVLVGSLWKFNSRTNGDSGPRTYLISHLLIYL